MEINLFVSAVNLNLTELGVKSSVSRADSSFTKEPLAQCSPIHWVIVGAVNWNLRAAITSLSTLITHINTVWENNIKL